MYKDSAHFDDMMTKEIAPLLSSKAVNQPVKYINASAGVYNSTEHKSTAVLSIRDELWKKREGIPIYRAVFVVVNAALGAGMLQFPWAYKEAGGIGKALSLQMPMLLFIVGAFLILAYCADMYGSVSYQDVVRCMLGAWAQIVCQLLIIIYMFGSSITFMILIGDQMQTVVNATMNGNLTVANEKWFDSRPFLISIISILFILPLCIPRKLKVLSYSSVLGGLGATVICSMIIVKYFNGEYNSISIRNSEEKKEIPWTHMFRAFPVICFAFQCHVSSVPVYAELHHRSVKRFAIVTTTAMLVCSVVYTLTGIFGYLTFGSNCVSDILENYNLTDHVLTAARIMIVIIIFSTYAVVHFCGRLAIESVWKMCRGFSQADMERGEFRRRIIVTLTWFFSSLILAMTIKTIGQATAYVGGIAALFIFMFPGLCLIQAALRQKQPTFKNNGLILLGVIYVFLGVFLFVESTALAIVDSEINSKSLY